MLDALYDLVVDLFNLLPSRNRVTGLLFLLYRRLSVRAVLAKSVMGDMDIDEVKEGLKALGVEFRESNGEEYLVLKPVARGWWFMHSLLELVRRFSEMMEPVCGEEGARLAARLRAEPYVYAFYAANVIVGGLYEALTGRKETGRREFNEWLAGLFNNAISGDKRLIAVKDAAKTLHLEADMEVFEEILGLLSELGVIIYIPELKSIIPDNAVATALREALEKAGLKGLGIGELEEWLRSSPFRKP